MIRLCAVAAAGEMWSQIVRGDAAEKGANATLDDDDQVIVVVDSRTGEVRQCGNLSGYCVRMNPWTTPTGRLQSAPAAVAKHAVDLAAEKQAALKGGR